MIRRDVTALYRGSKSRPCLYYVTMCYRHTTLIAYQIGGLSSFCKANLRFRWSNSHPEHVSRSMSVTVQVRVIFLWQICTKTWRILPERWCSCITQYTFTFSSLVATNSQKRYHLLKKSSTLTNNSIMSDYRCRIPLEKRYYIYNQLPAAKRKCCIGVYF